MTSNEHHILTPQDLSSADRMIKVALRTGKVHTFSEDNDRWKFHRKTLDQLHYSTTFIVGILKSLAK